MELEKLLNKLIEKGREPFGNYRDIITRYKYDERFFEFNHEWDNMVSIRELVSKESWLWQFVCENRMTKKMEKNPRGIWINSWSKSAYEKCPVYTMEKAEYRLIESALCDEEDLEKFLLDNIKIEWNEQL